MTINDIQDPKKKEKKKEKEKNLESFLSTLFRPSTKQNISARTQTKRQQLMYNKEIGKMVHVT